MYGIGNIPAKNVDRCRGFRCWNLVYEESDACSMEKVVSNDAQTT